MATVNPFDLLGDDDTGDVSQLIAAQQQKAPVSAPASAASKKAPAQAANPAAKLPTKPPPPAQAVREASSGGPRGGGRGGGRGRGFNRESPDENAFGNNEVYSARYKVSENGDDGKPSERRPYSGPRGGGGSRGGRRGGFSNGDTVEGERQRRVFERRSGTGRGNEIKREGSGRGNWGTPTDEIAPEIEEPVNEGEKIVDAEKQVGQEDVEDANKDSSAPEQEEKEEPEEKEMTLEEYEKSLEEKRKALLAHKAEERKVDLDKEFESMQLLSNKKNDDEVFIKLGSEKDKRKEAAEKVKKSVSINEFLKPAEGENYRPGGRGRGRGSGSGRGGYAGNNTNNVQAPSTEDASGGRGRGRGRGSGRGGYAGNNSNNVQAPIEDASGGRGRGRDRGSGRGGYAGNSTNNVQAPSIEDASHFPSLGGK